LFRAKWVLDSNKQETQPFHSIVTSQGQKSTATPPKQKFWYHIGDFFETFQGTAISLSYGSRSMGFA